MIDQPTIDRILDAANIVDVVSEFVTLRKRGVNYVGLCPFHDDKTPSFYVSPSKNICKCFACGEGGTAVHFIMKHEQLGYFDALRYLAKKYNIEIQERELTDKEKQARSDRESMFIVNAWAQKYFTSMLHNHIDGKTIGMRYFIERGFREETIRKFQLGYSLDKRDALYQEAIKSGYKKEFLEKTGLVIAYEDGRVNDRFRGRVIFPVHSLSGKVVAFGGRVLKKDEKTAKYVNSPESDIYHKSNELYGIYFAKQAMVKADRCFLVEGYTDVISMHQSGVENVVASSGTALTHGQIRIIHRFTDNITVLYDGDAAGIKAALRGIDLLLMEGMNVKVVLLPDGEDPDSFARSHSANEFSDFIQKHETDFIRFKTQLLLEEAGNDPIKRAALIGDIIRTIAIVPDDITRTLYIRECSAMMEIDEQVVLNQVNKIKLSNNERPAQPSAPTPEEILPKDYVIPTGMRPVETVTVPLAETDAQPDIPPYFPPPEEEEIPNGENTAPPPAPPMERTMQVHRTRSPYEAYEIALLRYVVRYGERILFEYPDEKTNALVTTHVAEYIKNELEKDGIQIYTTILQQMLDEAVAHCKEEGFTAQRYFLAHPDSVISRVAANLLSEKYQLSKYHSKYREVEQEEEKLDQIVVRDIFALKEAYILNEIKQKEEGLKHLSSDETDKMFAIMKEITQLNEIKKILSKELGERIILKM